MLRSGLCGGNGYEVRDETALPFRASAGCSLRAGGGLLPQVRSLRDAGEPGSHRTTGYEVVQNHARCYIAAESSIRLLRGHGHTSVRVWIGVAEGGGLHIPHMLNCV